MNNFTPEQLDRLYYNTINKLSSGNFSCGICCIFIAEKIEAIHEHLDIVHVNDLLKLAKKLGFFSKRFES